MSEKGNNQSETEFFALVGTGRKGVEHMLATMGEEIKAIAAPNVNGGWETWSKRALVEISNREELAPILSTRAGMFSIYKCLAKAATMGLQIGGVFPQAYFMPAKDKAELVVTAEGYSFSAAHGPGAVLRSTPELIRVYANDRFLIDQKACKVEHTYDPRTDRGKLSGWYMRLEYNDGHVEIHYVSVEKVRAIQTAYSRMKTSAGGTMPSFAKSPDEMDDKTAAKRLLRKPAREAEGLAMLLSLEGPEDPVEEAQPERNVTERTSERLERALDAQGPAPEAPEPEKKQEQSTVVSPDVATTKGDLF